MLNSYTVESSRYSSLACHTNRSIVRAWCMVWNAKDKQFLNFQKFFLAVLPAPWAPCIRRWSLNAGPPGKSQETILDFRGFHQRDHGDNGECRRHVAYCNNVTTGNPACRQKIGYAANITPGMESKKEYLRMISHFLIDSCVHKHASSTCISHSHITGNLSLLRHEG